MYKLKGKIFVEKVVRKVGAGERINTHIHSHHIHIELVRLSW